MTIPPNPHPEQVERLTPAQLDSIIGAINFVLAGEFDASSHPHSEAVLERALSKLHGLSVRVAVPSKDDSYLCHLCDGQGGIGMPDDQGRYRVCPRCGGSGEEPKPASLANRPADDGDVAIWSGEHQAYWRKGADGSGAGYTTDTKVAGQWSRHAAIRLTGGCGPEKLIALHDRPSMPPQPEGVERP